MQSRQKDLAQWLQQILSQATFTLTPLTGDASFRSYIRLYYNGTTRIIMDVPPEQEDLQSFLNIASLLYKFGICVPKVHAIEKNHGFVILDDFGDELLLHRASSSGRSTHSLYIEAINTIIKLQSCLQANISHLAVFNQEYMLKELEIFTQWFLSRYLKIRLSAQNIALLEQTFNWLSNEIVQQPHVFIHRDFHSRNVMLITQNNSTILGIIDFQDAMRGPLTYDLVSLLKDCYIKWPESQITQWVNFFYHHSPLAQQLSSAAFRRAFDLCGLQRHLKILGIFARLYLRDQKAWYLQDIPLTIKYIRTALQNYYAELKPFYLFMQTLKL